MSPKGRHLTASQVGQYVYCSCAWWLSAVEKRQPATLEPLEAGRRMHERHGLQVALARQMRRLAAVTLVVAALALGTWGLVRLLG